MATKTLCCTTTEEESRSNSPAPPNVRVTEPTPTKRPLLQRRTPSPGSRQTSTRSEDLVELRQIFDNARDNNTHSEPVGKQLRTRFTRPSAYSLHSLHKIKSVHALIKRKLSKDLSKAISSSGTRSSGAKTDSSKSEPNTVVRVPRDGANLQLKITKENLRKDLLSDKRPNEGGYDSDAEVLDDIARKVGKSASKRPSVHSIDWTSSPLSNYETPKLRRNSDVSLSTRPYQLDPIQLVGRTSATALWNQYCSSPNLHFPKTKGKDRVLRRSQSASSLERPIPSPLSFSPLPHVSSLNRESIPWSESTVQSLRLANLAALSSEQIEVPPVHASSAPSTLGGKHTAEDTSNESTKVSKTDSCRPGIRVQEPTATVTPRTSASIRSNRMKAEAELTERSEDVTEDTNPRSSIHLYSMRISHHLRSGSLLSWDKLNDPSDDALPNMSHPCRERTLSQSSPASQSAGRSRRGRQTSSSGFASSCIPSKWGRVLPQGVEPDAMSSNYSSRPHSPPDSFGGSALNFAFPAPRRDASRPSLPNEDEGSPGSPRTVPTDDEETPRPLKRHGVTEVRSITTMAENNLIPNGPVKLARNNSVATTKKSKFREEFSPSPPRKKSTPTMSIMRILRPRNSLRSHSDTNLKALRAPHVDGSLDTPSAASKRERRLSRSLLSLEKEEQVLEQNKESDPMWERALKAYQNERSTMFLPNNKELTVHQPLFRKRSSSCSRQIPTGTPELSSSNSSKQLQQPSKDPTPKELPDSTLESTLTSRRSALVLVDKNELDPAHDIRAAFDTQTNDGRTVGAWGRYPSHSRAERNGSAGPRDSVQSRDFALEAAIRFAEGDDIDPALRTESSELLDLKRRKKLSGSGRMAKSHSMTFGKQFLKNYTRIFRSQSSEFQRHGHGHRSSITAGGMLEYPELEMLPEVWRRRAVEEKAKEATGESQEMAVLEPEKTSDQKGKVKLEAADSMATLRPRKKSSTDGYLEVPVSTLDGTASSEPPADRARVWSVYYEECMPSFPRISTELGSLSHPNLNELLQFDEFSPRSDRATGRHSLESRRASLHSMTMPARIGHSRHGSRNSRASVGSRASVVPSFLSTSRVDDEDGGEAEGRRSVHSVRRSTIDLVEKYREQEVVERERVLSLMRGDSLKRGALGMRK